MKSKPEIFGIPKLKRTLEVLIRDGKLHEGLESVCEILNKTFAEKLAKRKKELSTEIIRQWVDILVWTKSNLALVKKYVREELPLEGLYEQLSFLPASMVQEKVVEIKGKSPQKISIQSEAGILRLIGPGNEFSDKADEIFPKISSDVPFEIPVPNKDHFRISFPNAPEIGLLYNKDMTENALRCALVVAQQRKSDAVVIPGGLFFLYTKRSGDLMTHNMLLSGLNYDPDVIDPEYRPVADRIRSENPPDQIAYDTFRERTQNLINGYDKITHYYGDPNHAEGEPVFSGQIYVMFGILEEEISEVATTAEIRYITNVTQTMYRVQLSAAGNFYKESVKKYGRNSQKAMDAEAEIKKIMKILDRARMTNAMVEDRKRFANFLRALIAHWVEKAIPNAKVVAQGTTYLKAGESIIKIHQLRDLGPSDTFLEKFMKEKSGAESLDFPVIDVDILVSPYSINRKWAAYENVKPENGGFSRKTTHVHLLPVLLDKDFFLPRIEKLVRKSSPIERLVRHPQFQPGMLELDYQNGIWQANNMSMAYLKSAAQPIVGAPAILKKNKRKKVDSGTPYLIKYVDTDQHAGDLWKERYWDPESKSWLSQTSASLQILRRAYREKKRALPIHATYFLDDPTQGHHFQTQAQPHEEHIPLQILERWQQNTIEKARELENPKEALESLEKLTGEILYQIKIRGEHWPQFQVQEFKREAIYPNMDIFASVIRRNIAAKVNFRGPSELFPGQSYNSRDLAPVVFGSGNHFAKSVLDQLMESFISADAVRDRLMAVFPELGEERLERLIRAPRFGNKLSAIGRVGVEGCPEWGVILRPQPSRKSGQNGDPLREAAKNAIERGDYTRILRGIPTIVLSGDIHRYGLVEVPAGRKSSITIISCAPGKDTDPYGEWGFSPNNVGSMFICLPVMGPTAGPLVVIPFTHDFVRKQLLDWKDLNIDSIFPNPA